jgi:hypothetical protein
VDAYVDGDYLLEDGEDPGKYVRTRVRSAYLQPQPVERPVYLQHLWNILFVDIEAGEAAAGITREAVDLFLKNPSPQRVHNVRAWIEPGTPYLQISPDRAVWSSPTTEAAGLQLGGIAAGGSVTLGARIVIPPATSFNPKVGALLHFAFDGV